MLVKLFLFLMIVFAIFSIQTTKLIRAVVYLGIFSLISSFSYLIYNAPDVAIAEAVIGSTISVILYLVAIQKCKVFVIYYVDAQYNPKNEHYINRGNIHIINLIGQFCSLRELEPHVIYTTEKFENIKKHHNYDLIVMQQKQQVLIYGNEKNYQMEHLKQHIPEEDFSHIKFALYDENEEV